MLQVHEALRFLHALRLVEMTRESPFGRNDKSAMPGHAGHDDSAMPDMTKSQAELNQNDRRGATDNAAGRPPVNDIIQQEGSPSGAEPRQSGRRW